MTRVAVVAVTEKRRHWHMNRRGGFNPLNIEVRRSNPRPHRMKGFRISSDIMIPMANE